MPSGTLNKLFSLCCYIPIFKGNWQNEIKKWCPTLHLSTIFVSANMKGQAKACDLAVNTFVTGYASRQPLLVISYEMFRTYAQAFNTCDNLDVLLCDEGHRLKNSQGTKTTLALGGCRAMRRLVLTGTPVQNDLEELFAVVDFAVPAYLGPVKEFRKTYDTLLGGGRADARHDKENSTTNRKFDDNEAKRLKK